MSPRPRPTVTIAMPALNEAGFIERAIRSILPRGNVDWELLVLDGGSTDRTRDIVHSLSEADDRIRLLDNPKRRQAAAMNLAAREADPRSRVLIRADCHSLYPPDFVARCVSALAESRAGSVVVPMNTEGKSCLQRAIAAAQNSRLGNGGAAHRAGGRSGYVDHGHHAAFDRQIYLDLGGYDESFGHNEDAEFDTRLTRAGHRIYLDGDLGISYFPRADFLSLARQYRNYGAGRARHVMKHGKMPRLRQMLPVAALIGCAAALPLAILDPGFLLLPLAYLLACILWGAALAFKARQPCLLASGLAAIVMHMSWAAGFLSEAARRPSGTGRAGSSVVTSEAKST